MHSGESHACESPRSVGLAISLAVVVLCAILIAAPWLRQELVASEWLGIAAAFACLRHLRGWRGEGLVLLASIAAIATSFHWSPKVLAYAMDTSDGIGLLVAIPIICWDAMRLAIPFWCAGRLARSPLEAWVPAGLAAVVTESVMPGVFPWKLGYSQIAWTPLVQAADLFGPEWATLVVFAHAGTLLFLADRLVRLAGMRSPLSGPQGNRFRLPVAGLAATGLCLANLAYGGVSIAQWKFRAAAAPSLRLALVQSNPEDVGGIDSLRKLTTDLCATSSDVPDLVCWPECSGGSYEEGLESLADRQQVLDRSREPQRGMRPLEEPRCQLLFGGKIFRGFPEKPEALYQSAILIDADHSIRGRYHKRHLMPFGEYVPGGELYPDLKLYFPMQDDFTTGTHATVLDTAGKARLGVMLCYEDMIPEAACSLVANSANVLVSLINGAAFTEPLTLAQHRLLAQLRAVEQRRSFVRCAATGETCLISPTGAIDARLPVQTRDILLVDVPLLESRTVYSRIGSAFPLSCGVALAALALRRRFSGGFRTNAGKQS